MRTTRLVASIFLLFSGLLNNLVAQEPAHVIPGARVRMTAPTITTARIVGNVMAINADTIILKRASQFSPLAVPLAAVTKLEVSRSRIPRGKNSLKGAGYGLLAGITIGGIFGAANTDADAPSGVYVLAGVAFFGSLGLVTGGVIGAVSGNERWEQVPLKRLRLGLAPGGKAGLALSTVFTF